MDIEFENTFSSDSLRNLQENIRMTILQNEIVKIVDKCHARFITCAMNCEQWCRLHIIIKKDGIVDTKDLDSLCRIYIPKRIPIQDLLNGFSEKYYDIDLVQYPIVPGEQHVISIQW